MSSRMAFQVGDRFGKLVILRQNGVHKKPCGTTERRWLCKCDCGHGSWACRGGKNGNGGRKMRLIDDLQLTAMLRRCNYER